MATANICDIFCGAQKITANICAIFCEAQKIPLKISQNNPEKNYGYRKYLRYFLRSAKITANICAIFCEAQKIPLKISQNNPKKTYGSYMLNSHCYKITWYVFMYLIHKVSIKF